MTDVLDAKIKTSAEYGITSFGHNGEVYADLRPHTAGGGLEGYRFDHGEKSDPYLKVYFVSDDGTYLSVWERGHGTEYLRFTESILDAPEQTLDDRLNSLNAKLDEAVFHARLEAAVQAYEETGQPQEFEWRGNTYTNLHDPGKSVVDYRFQHGQGDELKVFFFAEDGSYVSGWSRAGQTTYAHPDRTETDNLYDRLVEVDELLPASFVVPLTLEQHLDIFEQRGGSPYGFQIAGRDMHVTEFPVDEYEYSISTDYDFVNRSGHTYFSLSDDGTLLFGTDGGGGTRLWHRWGWTAEGDSELGELLYGNGLQDTLYNRLQLIEYDLNETLELFGYFEFLVTIDQAADGDGVRIAVTGEGADLFGYYEITEINGALNHDRDGSEIEFLDFSSEIYDLYGYGETSDLEGSIRPGNYSISIETHDALGYDETIVIALDIAERRGGYGVTLELDIDSPDVSADCTANADVSDDLTVTSLDVNCSDADLESDIEDVFDDALVESLAVVQDENLQAPLNITAEFDFVDETAPVYVGAFAPVDNDDWFL